MYTIVESCPVPGYPLSSLKRPSAGGRARGRRTPKQATEGWPVMNTFLSRCIAAGLFAVSVLFMGAAAHAETTLEKARKAGYIRVGFANEAPFGFATPDGKLTGESPEVVRAVLAKLGIKEIDGVLTEFGSLIPGIHAGRFDIVAAGLIVHAKRCLLEPFSQPNH